ncbi:MAG: SdiA-regulated domain-containing protein [Spirochaetales bacterium]|nr:SdiA-regulated domain-containing protein [Spirochaetales bacterium]
MLNKNRNRFTMAVIITLTQLLQISCIETQSLSQGLIGDFIIPYDLYGPAKTIQLPRALKEISGIIYYQEGVVLCCEDETGKVYAIDLKTGDILDYFDFGKKGDYEDLALAPNREKNKYHIYVLRTDTGNLYRINNLGEKNQKEKVFKTFLKERHNAEGLCYLPEEDILLLACKNSADKNKSDTDYQNYIYAFDMNDKKTSKEPYITLDTRIIEKAISPYKLKESPFQPSAIAQRPGTDHLYILSSVNKALLIIDKKGNILNYYSLPAQIFTQPEGISFSPEGELFISNEGKDSSATILYYSAP